MRSTHSYTKRFGIGTLMRYFLDEAFLPEYLEWVASIKSDEYYIRMMQAWFFATALAKQWDSTLPYIEQHRLEKDTHNKTIQKAVAVLLDEGLIDRSGAIYSYCDPFYKYYISNYTSERNASRRNG